MGVGTDKVVTAAIVCIMVKCRSSNGRRSRAGSSFLNFLDDLCKIQMKQKKLNCQIPLFGSPKEPNIQLFGYSGDPNNGISSYLVIWVTRITKFGDLGHPKKTEETKFGDNRPKPLGSLANIMESLLRES
jgi:hypothetical protein